MASGSFNSTIYATSGRNIGTVTVDWTSTPNVDTNSSTVTVTVTVANSASSYVLRNRAYSISCLGSAYHNYTASSGNTLASRTFTINHNADGTKSGVISFYVAGFTFEEEDEDNNITTHTVNAFSVYGNAVLDTIARGSTPTLSASSVEFGQSITIKTNRASTNFTHTLRYSFGAFENTLIASSVADSYTWTVPLSISAQIPSATSGVITISCETFNGSTSLGTKTVTFIATVPDSIVPTITTIECTDPTGYLSTYGGYVQGKSKVKVHVAASATSSSIVSYKITGNGFNAAVNDYESEVLTVPGTNTITVTVTDARGRTATKETTINVLAYTSPTISKFTAYRCNLDGTENPEGTYLNVSFAGSVTALNNKNSKSFKINYKQESASTYNDWVSYSDAYSYNSSFVGKGYNTGGFSADILWNLLFTVTDDFTSATYEINIPTAEVLMDFLANGKGIAFGKVATEEGFDCNFEGHFRQDVVAGYGTDDEVSLLELKDKIGTGGVVIDDALSDTSTNPVQNKVVREALLNKAPASNSDHYVKVLNSGVVNADESLTLAGLAKYGNFAMGMIKHQEDNPLGSAAYVHALSMGWTNGTYDSWTSQLAMGVENSDGLYYRTERYGILNKPWKRVLDSSNYKNYCTPANIGAKPIRRCRVGQSGSTVTNPWYKFASITTSAAYEDKSITFKVSTGFDGSGTIAGILTAHFRVDGNKNWQRGELMWEYAGSGINLSDYVLAYKNTGTSCEVELWTKISTGYAHRFFEVLTEHSRTSYLSEWHLHSTSYTGYADAITEGYTQIASTVLPRQAETIASSSYPALTIERLNSTGGAIISFKNSNGVLGHICMSGTANAGLIRYNKDMTANYTMLDSYNYKNYCTPSNIGAATIADITALDESIGTLEEGLDALEGAVGDWETVVLNLYDDVDSGTVTCYKNAATKTAIIYLDCLCFGNSGRIANNIPKPAVYCEFPVVEDYTKTASAYIATNGVLSMVDWTDLSNEFSAVITYNYVD